MIAVGRKKNLVNSKEFQVDEIYVFFQQQKVIALKRSHFSQSVLITNEVHRIRSEHIKVVFFLKIILSSSDSG